MWKGVDFKCYFKLNLKKKRLLFQILGMKVMFIPRYFFKKSLFIQICFLLINTN